jgi:hypothetical protein
MVRWRQPALSESSICSGRTLGLQQPMQLAEDNPKALWRGCTLTDPYISPFDTKSWLSDKEIERNWRLVWEQGG